VTDPLVLDLTRRRRGRGLSQSVVAGLSGMTPTNLGRAERGLSEPRLSTLRRWADALGCDLALVPKVEETKARKV
jgi:transcriptional regulator with XRE-family HTH domain